MAEPMGAAEFSDFGLTAKHPEFLPSSECSERDFRNSLDDDDFWNWVLLRIPPGSRTQFTSQDDYFFFDDNHDDDLLDDLVAPTEPCPICGAFRECGTDLEGRPMIHCLPVDTEA